MVLSLNYLRAKIIPLNKHDPILSRLKMLKQIMNKSRKHFGKKHIALKQLNPSFHDVFGNLDCASV